MTEDGDGPAAAGRQQRSLEDKLVSPCEIQIYRLCVRCVLCTLSAIRLFPRFCKLFFESSTVVMQPPFCPGKQEELSENCLQNLRNNLMAESV